MTIGTILLIILILLLIGAIPSWPHSRSWGYGRSGILGVVLVVVIVLVMYVGFLASNLVLGGESAPRAIIQIAGTIKQVAG